MSERERVFQQFHYSSAANVMGAGNTHGWGVVSSSQIDDQTMNEEITNVMVSEYPIVKGKAYTEYMVYVSRYQTFLTIGISNSNSINNGRDSRFAHIFMPTSTQIFYQYPENFIPNLDWNYEKDIQKQKHLEIKKDVPVFVNLASLIKKLGFHTERELACFIRQVYLSLFKNAQVLYICNSSLSDLEFRKQAKDFAVLLLYLIPSKFYKGKSIAFFADSDIKSTSFVFRHFSDSPNQWKVNCCCEIDKSGYEETFYLDIAKKIMANDSGKSFRQLREALSQRIKREDYDSFFPIYYEMLVEKGEEFFIEDWKPQHIDGILYDAGHGKYWKLSVYLMTHLHSLNYSTKKVKSWYQKWFEIAKTKIDGQSQIEEVKNYLQEMNPLLYEELFPQKKETSFTEMSAPKKNYVKTDLRSLEEIEAEVDRLLMRVLTKEAEEILTQDLLTLYARIVKKQGNIKRIENRLLAIFEILENSNEEVAGRILLQIGKKYKKYDKTVLAKLVNNHFGLSSMPQVYLRTKEEEKPKSKETQTPTKKKAKLRGVKIALLILLLVVGGVSSVFAVKHIVSEKETTVPSVPQSSSSSSPSTTKETEKEFEKKSTEESNETKEVESIKESSEEEGVTNLGSSQNGSN